MQRLVIMVLGAVVMLSSCQGKNQPQTSANEERKMEITLKSPAFTQGEPIPEEYTCDGRNISPPLQWSDVPEGAKSLAMIVDDPDAPRGLFTHWIIYNIPPDLPEFTENVEKDKTLPNGARQGVNDAGKIGYTGPCPPSGTHRYFFKVYALDSDLHLEPGLTKAQLLKAMEDHTLAEGQLMGTYSHKQ
jgi:Raf kinase inhibitor-like YbhB/YbcL family protein